MSLEDAGHPPSASPSPSLDSGLGDPEPDHAPIPAEEEVWLFSPPKPRAERTRTAVAVAPPPQAVPEVKREAPSAPAPAPTFIRAPAPVAAPASGLAAAPAAWTSPIAVLEPPVPPMTLFATVAPNDPSEPAPELGWGFARRHVSFSGTRLKRTGGVVALVAMLVGALVYVVPRGDERGHPLSLSFASGRDYRFGMQGAFEGKLVAATASRPISETVDGFLTWHVIHVDPDGTAGIRAAFETTSHTSNGRDLVRTKVEWRAQVMTNGRIVSTTPPRERGAGVEALLFSLRQMSPLLPSGPVKPGATWSTVFDQDSRGGGGSVELKARSTLVRYDTVDRTTTAILTNDVQVPPNAGDKGSIYQRLWFDPVAGEVIESAILGHVDMTLQGASKEASASRLVGTATLQLHHVPMPPPAPGDQVAAVAATTDDLRLALSVADVYFTANRSYVGFTPRKASSISSALRWTGDGRARASVITIRTARAGSVLLVTGTAWGSTFCIARTNQGIRFGRTGATRPAACRGGW
jgi:hypothetical protein